MRRVLLATVLLACGCGGGAGDARPERPIVLVSGRDDHGLVAQETVELLERPEGPRVASVPDGTLAEVLDTRGEWLRVRTLEGRNATGWVNDYYLRGTLHVVGAVPGCPTGALQPNEQVEIRSVRQRVDGIQVAVRTLSGRHEWVARAALAEVPYRGAPPSDC